MKKMAPKVKVGFQAGDPCRFGIGGLQFVLLLVTWRGVVHNLPGRTLHPGTL